MRVSCDETVSEIIGMRRHGQSIDNIAGRIGQSHYSVWKICSDAGLTNDGVKQERRLVVKEERPREIINPCSLERKDWPVCREKRCYLSSCCLSYKGE